MLQAGQNGVVRISPQLFATALEIDEIRSTPQAQIGVVGFARPVDAAKNGNVPFEEALKKLESIVEAMESEDLPLETLLTRYEEGTQMAQVCRAKLAEAELKIQQLEKNAAGELKLKPAPSELSED